MLQKLAMLRKRVVASDDDLWHRTRHTKRQSWGGSYGRRKKEVASKIKKGKNTNKGKKSGVVKLV